MRARAVAWGLVVTALCGHPGAARALDPKHGIAEYEARVFGVRDGLPQATVQALAQTRDGYLWAGTRAGLARFDGRRFSTWRAEDTPALRIHNVRALRVDRAGDLWIGTNGGTGVIRRHAGHFETFEERIGHRGNVMLDMLEDRSGTFWFGSGGSVMKLHDGAFSTLRQLGDLPIVGSTDCLAEAADGAIWVCTLSGAIRWHDGRAQRFGAEHGLTGMPVTSLLAEPDGTLWIGTQGAGLFAHDQRGFRRIPVQAGDGQPLVAGIVRDRDGNLWIATRAGLGRVTDDHVELAPPGSAVAEQLQSLLEDAEGNLWAGTRTAGVVRLSAGSFTALAPELFQGRSGMSVTGDADGTVWVGTAGAGLLRMAPGGHSRLTMADGHLCTDIVWATTIDSQGGVWVGGDLGARVTLCRLDPRTGVVREFGYPQGMPRVGIRVISSLRDGSLWVGTIEGLYRLDGDHFVREELPDTGKQFETYAIVLDRDGVLWVAAANRLYRRQDGKWRWFDSAHGLTNGQIFSLHEADNGALWIGTLDGFSRMYQGKLTGWKHRRGFRSGPVYQVVPDAKGDLWLCTPEGVLRVLARTLTLPDVAPDSVLAHTRYGGEDGLRTDLCEGGIGGNSAWRSPAGVLWFPTGRGAAWVDPARLPVRPGAPPGIIEEVIFDGRAIDLAAALSLPAGRGDLRIGYTATRMTGAERLRFRYRLRPFDRDWIEAGDRRQAFYTNLPPGSYRFEIAAGTDDGVWNMAGVTTLALVLAPHVHQTWWFVALVLLAGGAVMAGVALLAHRRRLLAVEARHQAVLGERSRIARDLHDTLAQGFTGISVQLEAATARLPEGSERARDKIDRARALVRSSLADARRAVWDLRPEAADQGSLVVALSGIARQLSADVPVRVQVDGTPRPLPAAPELAIIRIGQEALTNAVRHAGATSVVLAISFLDDAVQIEVVDDGRGFAADAPAEAPGHFGLPGLRERALSVQANLTVDSRPGAGTRIALWVPVPRQGSAT